MISSEVQRTLVKSPPELWAELSDPEALARHLGELGEITITRVEPEKLVEWEAAGTTGSVAIKASGWGTKVTLSVTRQLDAGQDQPVSVAGVPEPAISEQPADSTAEQASPEKRAERSNAAHGMGKPGANGADEIVGELGDAPEKRTGGTPDASARADQAIAPIETVAAAPIATDGLAELSTDEPIASYPTEPTPDQPPSASPTAPSKPTSATEQSPSETAQIELTAAERFAPDFPGSLRDERQQEPESTEPPRTEIAAPETAPPKKPGFFARLFGRKKEQAPVSETATAPQSASRASAPPEPQAQAKAPAPFLSEAPAAAKTGLSAPTPAMPEPAKRPAKLTPAPTYGAAEIAAAARALTPAESPAPSLEPSAAEQAPDTSSTATPEASDPVAERDPRSDPQTPAPAPAATAKDTTSVADGQTTDVGRRSAADLAAELRAAEEEVTAMLTAVLDRLGAAHHRPFSRS